MYRKALFFFGWLLAAVVSTTSAEAQQGPVRQHLPFDAGWKFHLGNAGDPVRDFNYGINNIFSKTGHAPGTCIAPGYDDKTWETVQLPHDWAVTLPFQYVRNGDLDAHGYRPVGGLFPENSIGWYRKTFTLDRADSGKRYSLQFDGIYRDSKVWVNGYYIGSHFSGYTGVSFDITDFLHFDAPNTVVVRADATQDEGWFYEGAGIYRHVWLNTMSDAHIEDKGGVFVHTLQKGKDAEVTIETHVENKDIHPVDLTISAVLTDRSGAVLTTSKATPLRLAVDESGKVVRTLAIRGATLWSLDNPYLYRAIAILRAGGRVIDSFRVRFGVRTIRIDKDKGLFVNDQPVKIQGVSCHQDHGGLGSALPDYLQYYRIGLLKEMGVNSYRTTHNAPTPELLDACDSLGMLVMDETRLLNSGAEYEGQLRDLILRDRNHPSIFIWSVGNEEHATQRTDIGKRITQNQVLLQQSLDPTRTSTYACNMGNVYKGVNEAIPVRGFNYNLRGIDAYHREHPDQPIMGTEMASTVSTRGIYVRDTVRAYVPDYDSVFPPWASTAETWWTLAAAREWYMGGFAWTGFDYRGEPTPYRWPNINSHFGIMDMCGFPKTVYYYYQSWWTDKDVLHIAPHWNWKGKEGQPIRVWVNTNADNVELFLNGKSLGKKDMPRNGHLTWDVPYQPGTLEAVAFKKGRKIVSRVETTGEAYKIVLTPTRTDLPADGEGAAVVNVSVVDKEGREVPDASDKIRLYTEGDGAIIGVANGDPSSHEADKCAPGDWSRSLFSGRAQVIVQAGRSKGTIMLHAEGRGLQPAEVRLKTE
ncbi:MAG TPA: beta-galactosidase GalA [Puia sp.]|jgi:beta-galactosidase